MAWWQLMDLGTGIYYACLASVRFEHSICRASLMSCYPAMISIRIQSQICSANPITCFVQCQKLILIIAFATRHIHFKSDLTMSVAE